MVLSLILMLFGKLLKSKIVYGPAGAQNLFNKKVDFSVE